MGCEPRNSWRPLLGPTKPERISTYPRGFTREYLPNFLNRPRIEATRCAVKWSSEPRFRRPSVSAVNHVVTEDFYVVATRRNERTEARGQASHAVTYVTTANLHVVRPMLHHDTAGINPLDVMPG